METSGLTDTGNLALVNPLQAKGIVVPAAPEHLGPRVLELSSILQTTLELETQIELFGKEIQRYLAIDGLHYVLPNDGPTVSYGGNQAQRATYDLRLEKKSLGSVHVCRELPFTRDEITSLENLLCALVYPLRNALTYRHAVESASRDPLTGAQNRFALSNALLREVDLAQRQDQPLSLLVIDIDHFKTFNDTFGHSFGDDVLVAVAKMIESTVRRSDLLFRFGGEEFVVLASYTEEAGAMLLADRIRSNVEAMQTVRGRTIGVTVSTGVAILNEDETPEGFFSRADRALYAAKNDGRNLSRLG